MIINNPSVTISGANITEFGGNNVLTGEGAPGIGVPRVTPSATQLGDSFYNANQPASGSTQVLAPASNVNGVLVKANSCLGYGSSTGSLGVYVGTAAPTSDTTNEAILRASLQAAAFTLGRDVFLPAGLGIWLYSSAGNAGGVSLSYKVL